MIYQELLAKILLTNIPNITYTSNNQEDENT